MKKEMKKSPKLSRRYLWSFFTVVILVDLVLTILLFVFYSGIQVSRVTEYSVAQLNQVGTSTDILYDSLETLSNQVISDNDTYAFLASRNLNRLKESRAGIKLRAMRSAAPYLRYITLYNDTSKRFISTSSAGSGNELEVAILYNYLGQSPYVCFVRQVGASYNTQEYKSVSVYTFVFRLNVKTEGASDLVIIDVNDSYFNKALSNIRIEDTKQEIILVDNYGNIISEMSAEPQQSGFHTTNHRMQVGAAQLPHNSDQSGSYTIRDEEKKPRFVTYAKAPEAGWTIVNVLPTSEIYSDLWSLALPTLLLTLVTLIFGYIISRRASALLYAPIKLLYENYVSTESQEKKGNELDLLSNAFSEMYAKADRLEQGLISSFHESKNMYLRYLFSGEEDKVRSSLLTYDRLEINLSSPHYAIVLMDCIPQRAQESEEKGRQDANLFICYYALENMTREIVSASCSMEFLRTEENLFTLLLYLPENKLPSSVEAGLNTISKTMAGEFHIDTTICIGDTVDSWTDLNMAYEQTLIALNSRTAGHYGKVFLSRSLPDVMSSDLYYNDLHSKLADYVRSEDSHAWAAEFDHALAAMKDISFKAARTYFRHVLMSVLDDFYVSWERDNVYFARLMEKLDQVDACQNVQALRTVVLDFLSALSHRLSANRKNSNQDAALQAQEYIDQNYADPDISLRMLAERVNLSPAYLGKVFTTVTTFSFNDYLNNVRTAKACELLCSTKLPVSKISEEVGILNTNYFYSVFKKRYGITPSAYRKEHHENGPLS